MNDAFVDNLVAQRRAFGPGGGRGPFEPFGELIFPYVEMGAINSLDLFGDNELPVFLFYWINRNRYRRALDCGANLGLHSILMARCGWEVRAFEPDPSHVKLMDVNIKANDVDARVEVNAFAISVGRGYREFIRVCGNTTGSHLAGAKANPYGKLERFNVELVGASPHLAWADIAKIDIEGHEADLITGLPAETWRETDAFVEIGTEENARRIFEHLDASVNMFSPKLRWKAAKHYEELPHSCHDGLMFISAKSEMPWQ